MISSSSAVAGIGAMLRYRSPSSRTRIVWPWVSDDRPVHAPATSGPLKPNCLANRQSTHRRLAPPLHRDPPKPCHDGGARMIRSRPSSALLAVQQDDVRRHVVVRLVATNSTGRPSMRAARVSVVRGLQRRSSPLSAAALRWILVGVARHVLDFEPNLILSAYGADLLHGDGSPVSVIPRVDTTAYD